MKFTVAKLQAKDLQNGFLESLANLTVVDLTPEEGRTVYSKLDKNSVVFVARAENGTVIGTAMLFVTQRFIHRGGKVGHLEDVATRRGFERRGVGVALVKAVVKEAEKLGCYKVLLNCGEENVRFYEKCGFHKHETGMRLDLN